MQSPMTTSGGRVLGDFRGDFDQLASLMRRSWSENLSSSFLYTADYLASCFHQPGASFALAPTIYQGSDPIAFIAGFPRNIRYQERTWRILINTFLTVTPEQKKLGYGVLVWSELVRRARNLGFDGMMNYCVDGEAMNGMIVGCCKRMHLPVERVLTIHYLTNILSQKGTDHQPVVEAVANDRLLETCNQVSNSADLGRSWSTEEISWLCSREGAVVATHHQAERWGALVGQIMSLTDDNHTKVLMVEDILWGTLEPEERVPLLKKFMALAAGQGARIVTAPLLGYANMEPFKAVRFRASTRKLQAYFTLWKNSPSLEKIESLYLDVF